MKNNKKQSISLKFMKQFGELLVYFKIKSKYLHWNFTLLISDEYLDYIIQIGTMIR